MVSNKRLAYANGKALMDDLRYFGTYARFDTKSKKDAAVLLGADSLVGDRYDIVFEQQDGQTIAWFRNKFGANAGFLDAATSRRLSICKARSWTMRAYLSFVAFTDSPEPGHYWGQVAIVCNDPRYDNAVDAFCERVAALLADGVRPDVSLSASGIDSVLVNDGSWMTEARTPMPDSKHGTVVLKRRRSTSEKLIEQGRKGNKGCYVFSWAVIIIVIALVVYVITRLF